MRTSTVIALALAGVAAPVFAAPMFLESRSISDDLSLLSSLEDPDDLRSLFDNDLLATGPLPTWAIPSSSLSKVARKIGTKTSSSATKGKGSGSAPKSTKGSGSSSTKGSGTPSKPTTKNNDPPTSSPDHESTLNKIIETALPFLNSPPFFSNPFTTTEPVTSTDPAVSGDTTVDDGNSTVTDTGSDSTDTASSELDRREHLERQLSHEVKRELARMLMERAFADLD